MPSPKFPSRKPPYGTLADCRCCLSHPTDLRFGKVTGQQSLRGLFVNKQARNGRAGGHGLFAPNSDNPDSFASHLKPTRIPQPFSKTLLACPRCLTWQNSFPNRPDIADAESRYQASGLPSVDKRTVLQVTAPHIIWTPLTQAAPGHQATDVPIATRVLGDCLRPKFKLRVDVET